MIIYTTEAGYLTERTPEEVASGQCVCSIEVVEQIFEDAAIVLIAARKWQITPIEARKQLIEMLERES